MSLVVAIALSLIACGGEELPTAQEIVDGAIQALDNIRTYEFEMDVNMVISAESEDGTAEATIEINYGGALDLDNRQLKMDLTMSMALVENGIEETTEPYLMEAYLIDGAGYTMTTTPGTDPVWEKEEFSEAEWEEVWEETSEMLNLAESQIELWEPAEVEVIGSEQVKGVDCYVLRLTPDFKQLWETVVQQATAGLVDELGLPELTEEILDEASYSASLKQWVAKDTYFSMKAEIDMAIELTAEAMGYPEEEGEMSITTAINTLAYNYNQPVSIELPPEAEEATGY